MKLNRRSTILGIGALALGSGAVFSSAAFASSVAPDADLRVVSDQRLIVEAGSAFDDGGQVLGDPDLFIDPLFNGGTVGGGIFDNDTLGSKFVNEADPPASTVSARDRDAVLDRQALGGADPDNYYGINDDLAIYSAVQNYDTVRFEKIIRVRNESGTAEDIGIAYDRDVGQYGKHTTLEDGNHVTPELVQGIWQFEVNDPGSFSFVNDDGPLISPDPDGAGEGTPETIVNADDRPNDFVELPAGETVELDLVVDTEGMRGDAIKDEAAYQGFEPKFDEHYFPVVDLLDEITVGTWTGE